MSPTESCKRNKVEVVEDGDKEKETEVRKDRRKE
jgi:hypothetical protein